MISLYCQYQNHKDAPFRLAIFAICQNIRQSCESKYLQAQTSRYRDKPHNPPRAWPRAYGVKLGNYKTLQGCQISSSTESILKFCSRIIKQLDV